MGVVSISHGLVTVPMKPSNFTPDELLGLPALVESNKAWDALIGREYLIGRLQPHELETWTKSISASKGYIEIAHPEQYGLPPGVRHPTDPDKSVYGLAMTHQLHCLVSPPSRDISGANKTAKMATELTFASD